VFGAGFDDKLHLRHFGVQKDEKLRIQEMVNSKYVQSEIQNVFQEAYGYLQAGRLVCFSGTPCQVAGLKSCLKKDYDNLITIDLVCRGVASPALFAKYVEWHAEKAKSPVVRLRFRNKTYGYHSGSMMVEFGNGRKYYGSRRIDYMQKAYFSGACSRYSCYSCRFRSENRCSDFTIFDSWHADQLIPGIRDDDKGYTNILVHTEKGMKLLPELKRYMWMRQAEPDKMKRLDGIMIDNDPPMHAAREKIVTEALAPDSFEKTMQFYLSVTFQDKVCEKAKGLLHKLGILHYLLKLRKG